MGTTRGVCLVSPHLAWVEAGSSLAGSFVVRGSIGTTPCDKDKSPPPSFPPSFNSSGTEVVGEDQRQRGPR